ncbi:MAG: hypothetical protein EG822_05355 [Deltaproteobacteria bacterium]|nr:hypothetical protein [Deltaproteobacteria bacterium]TLN04380.1 MAG: hypothetical protein FDZ73_03585 [bacterium]
MKRTISAVLMLFMLLTLAACGGGDNSQPTTTTQTLSNPTFDGDIERTPTADIITQGMSFPTIQSVFAGIDPVTLTETRAFLNFPLTGVVPANAVIVSATLDIFIRSIQPTTGSVPILIDLVDFQPPTLVASDFDRNLLPPLDSISTTIFQSDLGQHVIIDVTQLMREAQLRAQPDFQIRILEDLGIVSPGIIEIDDTTASTVDRESFAPLLTVTWF